MKNNSGVNPKNPNRWTRGGQAKTADVNTVMSDFIKSQTQESEKSVRPKRKD